MSERALTFGLAMCVLGVYLSSTPPHLVSDLTGGMLATLIPFYLFPERPARAVRGARGNWKRSLFYLMPSAVSLLAVAAMWPWSAILLWPAVCYILVCWAYLAGKPTVFRKAEGCLDWAAGILLAPHVWASKSSLPYLRRRVEPWAMAAPNVFFGRLLSEREALPPETVAVIDLNAEQNEPERLRQFGYLHLAVLDQTLPTMAQLEEAVSFIERNLERGSVYIHCTFGYSRSAGVACAYLLKCQLATTAVLAYQQIRARRPQVSLSRDWIVLLDEYRAAVTPPPVVEVIKPANQESSSRH